MSDAPDYTIYFTNDQFIEWLGDAYIQEINELLELANMEMDWNVQSNTFAYTRFTFYKINNNVGWVNRRNFQSCKLLWLVDKKRVFFALKEIILWGYCSEINHNQIIYM